MAPQKNTIEFQFVSATNLASKDDPHMHQGSIPFLKKDSIRPTWTKYVDGKAAKFHSFDLARKRVRRAPEKKQ